MGDARKPLSSNEPLRNFGDTSDVDDTDLYEDKPPRNFGDTSDVDDTDLYEDKPSRNFGDAPDVDDLDLYETEYDTEEEEPEDAPHFPLSATEDRPRYTPHASNGPGGGMCRALYAEYEKLNIAFLLTLKEVNILSIKANLRPPFCVTPLADPDGSVYRILYIVDQMNYYKDKLDRFNKTVGSVLISHGLFGRLDKLVRDYLVKENRDEEIQDVVLGGRVSSLKLPANVFKKSS